MDVFEAKIPSWEREALDDAAWLQANGGLEVGDHNAHKTRMDEAADTIINLILRLRAARKHGIPPEILDDPLRGLD